MPESVDEIRKLGPEERIAHLKALEAERKKEIEAAEGLIKETVQELEAEEEKKKIPIPEAKALDLAVLQTAEEKQLVATHHFLSQEKEKPVASQQGKKSLEEVAAEENIVNQSQQKQGQGASYSVGSERAAFGDYLSSSRQTVTSGGAASPIESKVEDFYRERSTERQERGEDDAHKYFGQHATVSGDYHSKHHEDEHQREDFYKRRGGGPA